MKSLRKILPALVLGMGLALSGASFAQNANDQKAESCCASECCCKGDSCMMKKDSAKTNHATMPGKHECCGDSCPMMKEGKDKSAKHECCGDSCVMKKDDAKTNHANMADKHQCCCCGDSCSMKETPKV
jgi:hypothetical protein